MGTFFSEDTINFLNKMQLYYSTIYYSFLNYFLARACQIVEEVGENNGVQMAFDPESLQVKVHDELNQGYIDFVKNEAYKRIKDQFTHFISSLKIQEMIEREKLEGG